MANETRVTKRERTLSSENRHIDLISTSDSVPKSHLNSALTVHNPNMRVAFAPVILA